MRDGWRLVESPTEATISEKSPTLNPHSKHGRGTRDRFQNFSKSEQRLAHFMTP